jgi:aldose 1-epimerase
MRICVAMTSHPIPPSGEQLELQAGSYAAVVTEVGAGLRTLTYEGRDLIDPYDIGDAAGGCRGQLLAPWPNRVDGGRYEVDGELRQLDLSEPSRGNASHGLVRWSTWAVDERRTDAQATLRHRLHPHPGYPHVLDLTVSYDVDATTGLSVALTARNRGAVAAPWGFGAHPYLRAGRAGIDGCVLEMDAHTVLMADERGIPVGRASVTDGPFDFRRGARLDGQVVDHAFTDLDRDQDGRVVARLVDPVTGHSTALWADRSCAYLQVYTAERLRPTPRTGVAVEPMSCAPNAFVTGDGLRWLEPDDMITHRFGIAAG